MELAATIDGVLLIDPTRDALEFGREWLTWEELDRRSRKLCDLLDAIGAGPDTRIGVLLRNHCDLVPVLLGLFRSGRCLASLNAVSPDAKLADDIRDAAVPVLVACGADWERPDILAAAREAGSAIVSIDGSGMSVTESAISSDAQRRMAPGVAIEMLSSGTTGKPKRIPLPRRNLERALAGAASYEKGRDPDAPPALRSGVAVVTAPLAHIAGITGVMNNLLAGRKVCLIERFTVEGFRDAVVRHRPKVAGAPPSALRMILDADIPKEDFSSLVAYRTGTAPLDPALADAFYEKYGIPVLQNYGATEFAGGVAGWTLQDFKAHWKDKYGAVGRLNANVEAHVVDPDSGEELAPGEQGLLELRAPNVGDGKTWVRTTDLAVIDAQRFLYIKGRHDGAIIRGGFKIMPDDVIKAMQSHPAVREASVVALPDRRLGQVPAAAWIAKDGVDAPDEAAFREWLKEKLLPYQVPTRLLQVDDLPRTPSLKPSLPDVRALFETAQDA
ncbi:class I adenylate-forming enzyme family protein [Novosphingobium pentaromativorans]|uniref:AMP-dependent synthetase and ligase n=1 Tax=Novosphingobium pentaromativorans US6-1 TaxID=1088721 RepID=G6ECK0_9SPHN|nr:fatty acid--CoA ligase family protein [Novosphingobium pentaromativorans]AIT80034.1 AMP-dependent synthetase [Novosphingobium pentaromativorans US6-1]EHJ60911.1 AMP-dependent synthetase and ligase [Novosphingobium pentaromativorans US6-1]